MLVLAGVVAVVIGDFKSLVSTNFTIRAHLKQRLTKINHKSKLHTLHTVAHALHTKILNVVSHGSDSTMKPPPYF